jgi:hypothetical protein
LRIRADYLSKARDCAAQAVVEQALARVVA